MTELGQAIDTCMFAAVVEGRTRDTVRTYGHQLKWLLGYACERGVTTPGGLTVGLLQDAARDLLLRTRDRAYGNFKGGESAVRLLFSAARYFARWAATQGIHVPNLSALKLPRAPQRVQTRVTAEEFRALEAAVHRRRVNGDKRFSRFTSARDLALLSFLGDTGLRVTEVCALNLDDVDLEHGSVVVQRGKGGKGRALCILDTEAGSESGGPTIEARRQYLSERAKTPNPEKSPAFWISYRGGRFSRGGLLRVLNRTCRAAGISTNRPPHAFRRAHFTESYNADPSALPILVARMGWASMETNMIAVYTRGATVDLARTQPRPSLARQWRQAATSAAASPARMAETQDSSSAASGSIELAAAIEKNSELVRTLLQALHGAD
jgi:site-specific recombinase XerD